MNEKMHIAIDPGRVGGIAIGWKQSVEFYPMPDPITDIADIIKPALAMAAIELMEVYCVIEKVGGFMGQNQPGNAMFNFGENYGFLTGYLYALNIPFERIRPQQWQKYFELGTVKSAGGKGPWKKKLQQRARELFPGEKITLKTADAALLLYWAKHSER